MSLLDISSAQPYLQINMGILRAGSPIDGKALASSFILRNGKRPVSSWMPVDLRLKLHGDVGSFGIRRGRISITAVTFETEGWVQKQDVKKGNKNSQLDSDSSPMQLVSANEESEEMDEKEVLRRTRISKANKGKTPWNKGRKHSVETRELIRERTNIAMQKPEVRMRIASHDRKRPVSDKTKEELAVSQRRRWERRRKMLMLQEYCQFEWQNLIAEASRLGFTGELQWDSYKILNEQLHKKWLKLERIERMKRAKPKAPLRRKTHDNATKRRISAAMSAKWTDPDYREMICTALRSRKPKIEQSSNTEYPVQNHPEKNANASQNYTGSKTNDKTQEVTKRDAKYKDPSASSKLETIKNIGAQRETADTGKTKAIERARTLIAEVKMAMNPTELAAEKSPIAWASPAETRKVKASRKSLKTRQDKNEKSGEEA